MKRIVGPVIAIIAAASLNGCMMGGGMAGMEGMHGVRPTPASTESMITQTAPGSYEATYRHSAPGAFTVMAEVLPDGGDARTVATIAVRREATPGIETSGRRAPLLAVGLLGSVAMAAMMVAMLAR